MLVIVFFIDFEYQVFKIKKKRIIDTIYQFITLIFVTLLSDKI